MRQECCWVHAIPEVATSETISRASGVTPKADLSTVVAAGVMDSDSRRFVRIVIGCIRSKLIMMGLLSDIKLGWLQNNTFNNMV